MIVSTGYNYMLLNMARGRSYGPGDLICMFKKGSDGVLTAGLVMALIDTLVMVPFYYLINMTEPSGGTAEALAAWMQPVMIAMLAGTAVGVLVKLPFSMAFYLLADDPQKKGIQALKESVSLMKGHIIQFFVLQLSFVPTPKPTNKPTANNLFSSIQSSPNLSKMCHLALYRTPALLPIKKPPCGGAL